MEAVRIISSELLQPAQTREDAPVFRLTPFDTAMRTVPYQQRVLFYRSLGETSFESFLELLKSSLAEVLVIFYPFAGRIVVSEEDDGVMELHSGLGQSVKLTVTETGATLDQLGEFQPSEFNDSLCDLGSSPPEYPWTSDHPLLYIQVTRFSCGSVSLGFAFSHQAVDGVSAWQFMISWAEIARTGSVSMLPEIKYEFDEQEHMIAVTAAMKANMSDSGVPAGLVAPKQKEHALTKLYTLDRATIEKLKAEAGTGADGKGFSTFVVVCAYFWRKITLARGLSTGTTGFVFLVNCRGRFSSLGKTYFGNAIAGSRGMLDLEDEQQGVSRRASVLQEAIASFNNETAINTVGYINWLNMTGKRNEALRLSDNNMVQAIGSPRHPVYESDFGFGKPAGVTLGRGDLEDGKIYLFPSADTGGVTVTVVLKPENMERLLEQEK